MKTCQIPELAGAYAAGATVVDVREPEEYVGGHVPGALLIPLGDLPGRIHEVPRSGPVYVVCASGQRSRSGVELLEQAGFEAISLEGGTNGWIAAGRDYVTGPHSR